MIYDEIDEMVILVRECQDQEKLEKTKELILQAGAILRGESK